jgi:hypothetical protein
MLPMLRASVAVDVLDAALEGALEHIDVDEGLVGEVVAFEVAPVAL